MMLSYIKYFLHDPLCIACNRDHSYKNIFSYSLCETCTNEVHPLPPAYLSYNTKNYTLYSIGAYEGPLKKILHQKYTKKTQGFWFLGKEIADMIMHYHIDAKYIIPIPMHPLKKIARTFNQAEEIAHVVSKESNISLCHALKKNKLHASQSDQNKQNRSKNLYGTFSPTKYTENIKQEVIIILDDTLTTGQTIKEAIRTLLPYKPLHIILITAARTINLPSPSNVL